MTIATEYSEVKRTFVPNVDTIDVTAVVNHNAWSNWEEAHR